MLRLALVPVFLVVFLRADDGSSWAAGWIFLVAGVTDQVDGWLARRWRVESQFGKIADPLADRLMIDAAVILLWARRTSLQWYGSPDHRSPVTSSSSVGYRLLVPRGYELNVSTLGKLAAWILYLSVGIPARRRPLGPSGRSWLFWIGVDAGGRRGRAVRLEGAAGGDGMT